MKTLVKITLVLFMFSAFFSCGTDDVATPEPIAQPEPMPEPEPENQAPTPVSLLSPAPDAENIDVRPTFSWQAAIDPDGDTITYEIYADTTATPITLISTTNETSFEVEQRLSLLENYTWKVVAKDGKGGESETAVHNFGTRSIRSGITTNETPFLNTGRTDAIVYKNKIWQIRQVQGHQELYKSEDGVNWILVNEQLPFLVSTSSGFGNSRATLYKNEIWVTSTSPSIVEMWHSSDGIDWILATNSIPPKNTFTSDLEVFKEKIYFFQDTDIWISDDGVNWAFLSESPFGREGKFNSYVHQNRMYIKRGSNRRLIAYTEDGTNFTTLETTDDFHGGNRLSNMVVFDNKLWEIAGDLESTVNFSRDFGLTWERALDNAVFPPMTGSEVVVKDDKIIILSGFKHFLAPDEGESYNKVWFIN